MSVAKALLVVALLRGISRGRSVVGADFDYDAMAKKMSDAAAADDAAREKRKQEANDKLDDWGNAVDKVLPGAGKWLAGMSKLALAIEGAVVRWVQGDWNSDEQKARALAAAKRAIERGMPPRSFNADIDFAKTYADDLEGDLSRVDELDAQWAGVFHDYIAALEAAAATGDPVVASAFVNSAGLFSHELGTEMFCSALDQFRKGTMHYGLADLLAAVAARHSGMPLAQALRVAYDAMPKVEASHPSVCTGRGHKGEADTWEYAHAPILFVLQAWQDLSGVHQAVFDDAPPSTPPITPKEKLRKLAPLLLYFL